MRILVTGAGGFIGSHLTERLIADGHDVTAMARYCGRDTFGWLDEVEGCEKVRGDIRDVEFVRREVACVDRVYHLAALGSVPWSFTAPRSFVETNITGALNVAMACVEHGVELVHTSTSEVYGSAEYLLHEYHPAAPQSPYAASKAGADALVKSLSAALGLRAVILRPFNTYGPRQSGRAVIPRIVIGSLNGGKVQLGNVTARRDWLYISDTVAAFAAVQPADECRTFNAATGISVSVDYVAAMLGLDVTTGELRNSDIDCLRGDASAMRRAFGWQPTVDLPAGLAMTREWFAARCAKPVEGVI